MFVLTFVDYMIDLEFITYIFGAMAFCGVMFCLQKLILRKGQ